MLHYNKHFLILIKLINYINIGLFNTDVRTLTAHSGHLGKAIAVKFAMKTYNLVVIFHHETLHSCTAV